MQKPIRAAMVWLGTGMALGACADGRILSLGEQVSKGEAPERDGTPESRDAGRGSEPQADAAPEREETGSPIEDADTAPLLEPRHCRGAREPNAYEVAFRVELPVAQCDADNCPVGVEELRLAPDGSFWLLARAWRKARVEETAAPSWLAHYDAEGTLLGSRQIAASRRPNSLAVAADGVAWLAVLEPDGAVEVARYDADVEPLEAADPPGGVPPGPYAGALTDTAPVLIALDDRVALVFGEPEVWSQYDSTGRLLSATELPQLAVSSATWDVDVNGLQRAGEGITVVQQPSLKRSEQPWGLPDFELARWSLEGDEIWRHALPMVSELPSSESLADAAAGPSYSTAPYLFRIESDAEGNSFIAHTEVLGPAPLEVALEPDTWIRRVNADGEHVWRYVLEGAAPWLPLTMTSDGRILTREAGEEGAAVDNVLVEISPDGESCRRLGVAAPLPHIEQLLASPDDDSVYFTAHGNVFGRLVPVE